MVVVGALGIVLLQEKANPPLMKPQEEIKISISDLVEAYAGNPIAADEKYKNRILITVGVVDYIEKYEGRPVIILDWPFKVQCFFRNESELKNVKIGELVAIRGRNVGKVTYRVGRPSYEALILKDCSLVPLEKVRELKVEFDNETKTFRIKNFGYNLRVYLKPPNINESTWLIIIPHYQSNAMVSAAEEVLKIFYTSGGGEYVFYLQDDDEGNVLFNKTLIFEGPKLKIMEILKFKLCWIKSWKTECRLEEITAIVKNVGDLMYGGWPDPRYCGVHEIYVAKEGSTGEWFSGATGIFNPGEEKGIEYGSFYTLTEDEKGGVYRLRLETEWETLNVTIKIPLYEGGEYCIEVPPYGG